MSLIASYWWLWFLGLSIVLSIAAVRSLTGLFGLAKDTVEIAAQIRRATEIPSEERRKHLTNVGLEVVTDQI